MHVVQGEQRMKLFPKWLVRDWSKSMGGGGCGAERGWVLRF